MDYIATALPYCLIVILSAVSQLAPSLGDATRLHGHGRAARLLPGHAATGAAGGVDGVPADLHPHRLELPVSQLLIPLSGRPVPPFVVRLFNHDQDGLAAALSLTSMVVAGGLAGLIWLAPRRHLTFGAPRKAAS